MNYEIVDNFLSDEEFQNLKNFIIFSGNLEWYTRLGVSNKGNNDGFFLTHIFYNKFKPVSDKFEILFPLLRKIDPLSLIRIKSNFYPTTPKIIHHDFHVDFLSHSDTPISCKGCLFYLNTNNGKTIFDDGTEIESVENRALFFDPAIYHKSTTCTDDIVGRFNINFNYF